MRSYEQWLSDEYHPIAGGALESDIVALWWSKQTAKGSPATMTTAGRRGRMIGGDVQAVRADGSEPYSDNTLFGDSVDFVNTLTGNGAPVLQGQSGVIAHLFWLACGQETVTGGVNEVQSIVVTGATAGAFQYQFSLGGKTYTTTSIAYNATSAAVATAFGNAVAADGTTLGAPQVATAGGPLPGATSITFQGTAGAQPVGVGTIINSTIVGGTPTASVTTPGTLYQHTATPADTGGFYATFFKTVGKSVSVAQQYNDCRFQSVRLEGSSASKVVKVTPTFFSLDPGQIQTTVPTTVDDGTRPFIYTEASGAFIIDGVVYRGQSAFALVFTWGIQEVYGDDVTPYDVVNTRAMVQLEGITVVLDALSLQRYYLQYYGVVNPSVGAKPIHTLPTIGSYHVTFARQAEKLDILIPGVKWNPDALAVPANPTGGAVEFPLAGEMRKVTGQPPFQIQTSNFRDPAFTV